MGETSIQWCDFTFNPWQGCQRVSPGCVNCYAEARDQRFNRGKNWGPGGVRTRTSPANWRKPLAWNAKAQREGKRYRVFCASLADVFEDRPELIGWRFELFDLIRKTPNLDWLLLTKRPENIERMLGGLDADVYAQTDVDDALVDWLEEWLDGHPPENVWLGTTAEDQQRCDERLGELLDVPAAVHFLSCEPLLEPLSLGYAYGANLYRNRKGHTLDWLIVGGESGPGARPFHLKWARDLLAQARGSSIAPFVKQLGACASDPENGLAGRALKVPPDAASLVSRRLIDPAGGDMTEWPPDLRVREFPR